MTIKTGGASVLQELNRHAIAHNIPLGTHIDLTYRCDLACKHCYLAERIKRELTLQEIEAVLDDIQALGGLMMLFSGGDLFLRPDALDILRAACQRRFYVQIITHANHIDEAVADELAQMGVAEVKVSIYSSRPEVHDAITRVPGSLHASLRAISLLRQRNIEVEMKCPVMDGNAGAQLEIPLLAAKYDARYALDHTIRAEQGHKPGSLKPLWTQGGCEDLRDLNLDLQTKIDITRLQRPEVRSLADLDHMPPELPVCTAGRSSVYIDPEGNVFPCLEWEEPTGNVRRSSFREIWHQGEVFQRARQMTRGSFEGCTSCGNFSFCSMCPGQAYRETGSATGMSPTTCRDTTALRMAFGQDEPPVVPPGLQGPSGPQGGCGAGCGCG